MSRFVLSDQCSQVYHPSACPGIRQLRLKFGIFAEASFEMLPFGISGDGAAEPGSGAVDLSLELVLIIPSSSEVRSD